MINQRFTKTIWFDLTVTITEAWLSPVKLVHWKIVPVIRGEIYEIRDKAEEVIKKFVITDEQEDLRIDNWTRCKQVQLLILQEKINLISSGLFFDSFLKLYFKPE